jgi:Family of unknown function (DUF5677)
MTFEFTQTRHSAAFFKRHPKFDPAFDRLMDLANKCFGRPSGAKDQAEDVCFNLGHTCRDDYMEILFLALNGYGTGASKLLRGLYERAVTLAYIAKHPGKVDRFLHFAAIQEYRALKSALKVMTKEPFDDALGETATVAQITELYERFKPEFPGRAISWDVRLISMVEDVGEPYKMF